ncbi:MAG: AAA family ATPase, partial [Bdellovibrio sp.]|nr:AAA family ATPase [Bdellovibrio sp.]
MPTNNLLSQIKQRFSTDPTLMQVILGPRQVGKTTAIHDFLALYKKPSLYFTTEESDYSTLWLEACWQKAVQKSPETLLVIDEIQK